MAETRADAMILLARLKDRHGDSAEAERWAAETGHLDAVTIHGAYLDLLGRSDEAEPWHRRRAGHETLGLSPPWALWNASGETRSRPWPGTSVRPTPATCRRSSSSASRRIRRGIFPVLRGGTGRRHKAGCRMR